MNETGYEVQHTAQEPTTIFFAAPLSAYMMHAKATAIVTNRFHE